MRDAAKSNKIVPAAFIPLHRLQCPCVHVLDPIRGKVHSPGDFLPLPAVQVAVAQHLPLLRDLARVNGSGGPLAFSSAHRFSVAPSLRADITPANRLGLKSAWINRPNRLLGLSGEGAAEARPDLTVSSLGELLEAIA